MTSFCVTHLYFFLSSRQTDNFHPMISQNHGNLGPHTTGGSRHHGDFPLPSFHGEINNANQLFRRVKIFILFIFADAVRFLCARSVSAETTRLIELSDKAPQSRSDLQSHRVSEFCGATKKFI